MNIVSFQHGVDIGAACAQSARIAREEHFPITAARMAGYAEEVRDGVSILILNGIVQYRTDGTTVVNMLVNHKEYEVVITVKQTATLEAGETVGSWVRVPVTT